jgi:uncharacterized RDD family membrane protein YckC
MTDEFVRRVADRLPRPLPQRAQILLELESAVADRLENGTPTEGLEEALGAPAELAQSLVEAWPPAPAPHLRRLFAKVLDLGVVFALVAPAVWLVSGFVDPENAGDVVVAGALGAAAFFAAMTIVGELLWSTTPGKYLCRLAAIRTDGTRLSVSQAFVRHLPILFQVFLLDAAFALFNQEHQRAFEMLSKTRVVTWPEAKSNA